MVVDGDTIRSTLHRNLDFTPENIKENNRKIAMICHKNLGKYDFVLVSAISPFRESRSFARDLLSFNFIGISPQTPYETPINPEIKIDTEKQEPLVSAKKL